MLRKRNLVCLDYRTHLSRGAPLAGLDGFFEEGTGETLGAWFSFQGIRMETGRCQDTLMWPKPSKPSKTPSLGWPFLWDLDSLDGYPDIGG